jgi:hypothetical protein
MNPKVLEQLKSDEFAVSVGFLATPRSLRQFLAGSKEVLAVREALRQGAISENAIRRFVSSLMADFHRQERFSHELALAALAVAMETRPTNFAEEYVQDLARLDLEELSLCVRVARECSKQRAFISRQVLKVFRLHGPGEPPPFSISLVRQRPSSIADTNAEFTCGVA